MPGTSPGMTSRTTGRAQICRSTIFRLSSANPASDGLRPFGQAFAQFMIGVAAIERNGSSRLSSRSPVASSRLSVIQRVACKSAAGPRKRSLFHNSSGNEVEQQAHRMHS